MDAIFCYCGFSGSERAYKKHIIIYHTEKEKCIFCNMYLPKILLVLHHTKCQYYNVKYLINIPASTSHDYTFNQPCIKK